MLRDEVLTILKSAPGDLSGEEISRRLGVTRMAVSHAVKALRAEGYVIESATNRGYRMVSGADRLTAGELYAHLPKARRETVRCFDEIDSTNTYLKREAMNGAPHGLCAVANAQTAGRGRSGRGFVSEPDCGVYLSVLLRPYCAPERAMTLTAHAAVAVCRAIRSVTGASPAIKWTNDVLLNGRKVCGILTEITLEAETGLIDSVVIGVGVNVNNAPEDFPPELRGVAGSVFSETGEKTDRACLAAALILALDEVSAVWAADPRACLEEYRALCVTTGREVRVLRGDTVRHAFALEITDDFALRVRFDDGTEEDLNAGEVSVRGLCGYE